jgi:hypothetical protein
MEAFDILFYLLLIAAVGYILFRIIRGRLAFKGLMRKLEEDGLLLSERWVFTRFNFPMVKRLTFSHAYLTKRRFITTQWCSLGMVLQAPVGPSGSPGTEKGRFEVETRGSRKVLLLRTTLRGGGRIRFHLNNPDEWLRKIADNE